MSIADKLKRTLESKSAIKAALISKGIDLTNVPFRDYAGIIRGMTSDGVVDLESITVTPTGKTFTKYPSVDGFSEVKVKGDSDLVPENIREGVTIYGVTGEYVGSSKYPLMDVPEEYLEYVEYARENLYNGDFAELVIWDSGDWIAVSFLMPDFEITEYDPYNTEIKATGWFTCGYTKSTDEWTAHDYRDIESPGGNYVQYIKFASCEFVCGTQKLYPVPVMTEIEVTDLDFDDEAGTATVTLATGYSETYTYVYDDNGEVIGFTDSRGHSFTIGGL